jgi:hypothetical protein
MAIVCFTTRRLKFVQTISSPLEDLSGDGILKAQLGGVEVLDPIPPGPLHPSAIGERVRPNCHLVPCIGLTGYLWDRRLSCPRQFAFARLRYGCQECLC